MITALLELDRYLYGLINITLHHDLLDVVMRYITRHPPLLFLLAAIALAPRFRSRLLLTTLLAVIASGISDGTVEILKHVFMRERPFLVLPSINTPETAHSFSFPSAHASNAFAVATAFFYFHRRWGIPFLVIAVLVAFSRVYLGVHYPSDVLVGAGVGAACFFAALSVYRKIKDVYEVDRLAGFFFIVMLGSIPLRLLYIKYGPLDLIGDEAHYWEWSRRLALSYYSKGPVIAYLIALTTKLGGNTVVAVRFLAPVLLSLSSYLLYRLATVMFGSRKAGALAGILLLIVPLFATYGVIMTIDAPFLFFWCLGLIVFWKALQAEQPAYWYLGGIILGLGFLAKYIMAFFPLCVLIFLLLSKQDRLKLKSIHPYLAAVLSLVVASPVFIWNAMNGWVTFLHTAGHARIREGLRISPASFFEFIGSQVGVLTPLLFGLFIYLLIRKRPDPSEYSRERRYLLSFSLPVLAFFLLKSLQGTVEANWAMVGYPSLLVLGSHSLVQSWAGFSRRMKGFAITSFALTLLLTGVMHLGPLLGLPERLDPSARMAGWKELGEEADRIRVDMAAEGPLFIFSDNYMIASELAFYMKDHPTTYCVNLGRRMNQYDLWPGFDGLIGYNALFIKRGGRIPEILVRAFERYEQSELRFMTRQGLAREFTVVRFYNFKGGTFLPPKKY